MKPSALRVLMINRPDAQTVPGGDTVQMMQTKAALERMGVDVVVGCDPEPDTVEQFDLVHIFNWQRLDKIRAQWGLAESPVPIVLSTIFWFHTGHWFQDAVKKKALWRTANFAFGTNRARKVYEAWQAAKFRSGADGKALIRSFATIDVLLPNSELEIAHLEGILGLQRRLRGKSVVVPNGVDPRFLAPAASLSKAVELVGKQKFILEVARIQAAKNQLGLMQALADTSIPIVFAGQFSPYEPEYVAECKRFAEKRGNVFFTGLLAEEALHGLYDAAEVHALPSWRETPGLASLEAAAVGCKIVSTSIGSADEYFGADAWYCDPASIPSIRTAVMQAWQSPATPDLRERVRQRFTWEQAAKATLTGYHKALGQTKISKRNGG